MNVTFISYDGAYPNLCSGTLLVEIDSKKVSFGSQFLWESEKKAGKVPPNYPRFWTSGGSVSFDDDWNEEVVSGCDWEMLADKKDYPPEIWAALPDVLAVMNANVPGGCCGGCV